mgnify:CR=1 FL=1
MSEIPTPINIQSNSGLPIKCFTGESLLPDEPAREQLEALAAIPGLQHHVAVLPDVHYKGRNPSPTGSVVVSKDVLLPRAIDGGINCGIRTMSFPYPAKDCTPQFLDDLYGGLIEKIPVKRRSEPLLSENQLEEMLLNGLEKLIESLGIPREELSRVENRGRMLPHLAPETLRETLSTEAIRHAIKKGGNTLGTIGAGNHFLELQEIVEVFDNDAAEKLGLKKGNCVFMLHTDSRRLGKKILHPLIDEAREKYQNGTASELWQMPIDSEMAQRYLRGLAAASHTGYANRSTINHFLRQTIREVLGDSAPDPSLIYDCGHETVQRERYNGGEVWVHRHGVSRALPPELLSGDPVLEQTGQPVPIPGSMGTHSYLAVARSGAVESFYSVAHGAGRVMEKDEAKEVYKEGDVESDLRESGVRLYRYNVDNIGGQAPASFKSPHQVVDVMAQLNLIQPVVKLKPIAVLKG